MAFKEEIASFFDGVGISGLVKDASLVFLYLLKENQKKNIFLSFNSNDDAYSFYDYIYKTGVGNCLYYPETDTENIVPGFFQKMTGIERKHF